MNITDEGAVLNKEDLTRVFFKAAARHTGDAIGVEFEKFGLLADTGEALGTRGGTGLPCVLEALEKRLGWTRPAVSGPSVLEKEGCGISVEPGGQLELSTPPRVSIDAARDCELRHLEELKTISCASGVIWSGLGVQPVTPAGRVEWFLKDRYRIMRDYLPRRGRLGHAMMKATSSIQVAVDYVSEADAAGKIRLLMRLAPLFTALFANSCVAGGRLTGYKSFRAHIWQNTDPDRSGLVRRVFEDDFSFAAWTEYALDVPLFFITRGDKLIRMAGRTFRSFLEEGHGPHRATHADWELHLTCLFPEVRLRRWLEFRSVDRQVGLLSYAPPVLIKVLCYDASSRQAAARLLEKMDYQTTARAMHEAARSGPRGKYGTFRLDVLAREVMSVVRDAVRRDTAGNFLSAFEVETLRILDEELVRPGRCPADRTIEAFGSRKDLLKIVRASAL